LTPGGDQCLTRLPTSGDLPGIDAVGQELHTSAAIATQDSILCEFSYPRLVEAGRHCPALEQRLEHILSVELSKLQGLAMLLGYHRAEQKMAHFLLELARSGLHAEDGSWQFELPLSRQDIGDYLGFTDATVTRLLQRLQLAGIIGVERRHVAVFDMERLRQLLGSQLPSAVCAMHG
jgi:CRP/FNR family transcriptional regulator